jgi:hypothetical protein
MPFAHLGAPRAPQTYCASVHMAKSRHSGRMFGLKTARKRPKRDQIRSPRPDLDVVKSIERYKHVYSLQTGSGGSIIRIGARLSASAAGAIDASSAVEQDPRTPGLVDCVKFASRCPHKSNASLCINYTVITLKPEAFPTVSSTARRCRTFLYHRGQLQCMAYTGVW